MKEVGIRELKQNRVKQVRFRHYYRKRNYPVSRFSNIRRLISRKLDVWVTVARCYVIPQIEPDKK